MHKNHLSDLLHTGVFCGGPPLSIFHKGIALPAPQHNFHDLDVLFKRRKMQRKLLLVVRNVRVDVPARQEGRDTFRVSPPRSPAKGGVSEVPPDVYRDVPVPILFDAPVEDVEEGPDVSRFDA